MGKKKGGTKKPSVHTASKNGDIDAIQAFLDADPKELEAKNGDGWTPLICAAFHGEDEAVEMLIAAGANLNAVCKDGDTAVHYASAQSNHSTLKILAAKGANFDVTDNDGESPADCAGNKATKALVAKLTADAAAVRVGDLTLEE